VIALYRYIPPVGPGQTYSQGYWYAVIASVLYMIGSVILMVNMLGYFLGHYPQHFELDDSQRTLILQTMMFFFWLAGGAGVFSRVCGFSYVDALYFCDVTVLTIGFGDFTAPNDSGRGLIIPYAVFGIIFLGLMINSIRNFAASMSRDKIIKAHELHERERTFSRTVTSENELRDRLGLPPRRRSDTRRPQTAKSSPMGEAFRRDRLGSLSQYGHFELQGRTITFHEHKASARGGNRGGAGRTNSAKAVKPLSRDEKARAYSVANSVQTKRADRRKKLLLLKEEKDRFDAMREIQQHTNRFKQYYALAMSTLAFSILWCVGAVIFMITEQREQSLSYFEALYFCYVSLLTIGYGDFSPKSNAGKPFFVIWSLLAIPTMTILISDMGDTVVTAINRGTFTVADWTVMPRDGIWHDFLEDHPRLKAWIARKHEEREEKKRIKRGFTIQNPDMDVEVDTSLDRRAHPPSSPRGPTLEELASSTELTNHELARKLAMAIKRAAHDLHAEPPKKYSYEEWVEFTRLIRFSVKSKEEVEAEEQEEGLVEWDWIGEDSPMLANITEAEWVLDRLCESLNRYTRKQSQLVSDYLRSVPYLIPLLFSRRI
jgi:potassium channel subfamily K, other eukaryote